MGTGLDSKRPPSYKYLKYFVCGVALDTSIYGSGSSEVVERFSLARVLFISSANRFAFALLLDPLIVFFLLPLSFLNLVCIFMFELTPG